MKLIFWGLILVFFDFHLNIGACSISLLPAFVGYILIGKGMKSVDCGAYVTARPWVTAGIIYSAIVWVLNCLGVMTQLTTMALFAVLFAVGGTVILMGVLHRITGGICEIEQVHGWDLQGRALKTAWTVTAVWVVLMHLTSLLGMAALAVVALIAAYAFEVYYLFRYHKSRKAYEDYEACREE